MAKYKKIRLNMRQDNLESLLFSFTSDYAPSRASVANACSVSKVTSGKVADALLESGFMIERIFSTDGKRPCAHLFFRSVANVLVIDISSSVFKMSAADSYGEIKFHAEHRYDTAISTDDNLYIFLSRCASSARKSNRPFLAISVIYADGGSDEHYGRLLPRISDKESVTNAICDIFGKKPISHLTVSETVAEAMRFKAHGNIPGGISYVFIGDHLSLFHVYPNGSITVCKAYALLSDIEKEHIVQERYLTKKDGDLLFVRLCNFMGAAFSPSAILLESDIYTPDGSTGEMIIRKFALSNLNAPIIFTKDNEYALCLIGAVRSMLFRILKKYITTC